MRIRTGQDFQIQFILYGKQQNPDCAVRIDVLVKGLLNVISVFNQSHRVISNQFKVGVVKVLFIANRKISAYTCKSSSGHRLVKVSIAMRIIKCEREYLCTDEQISAEFQLLQFYFCC